MAKPSEEPSRGIRVLEALAATGLRSIRYAKEVPGLTCIIANDLDPRAVEYIAKNVVDNGIPEGQVVPNLGDARFFRISDEKVIQLKQRCNVSK